MLIREADQGRRNNFDFLRFMLATCVIFGHSYALLQGVGHSEDLIQRLTGGQAGGGTAVTFFFVISGFLITESWRRSRTAGEYFRKRLLRIYPAFIADSLFCALVVGPLGADSVAAYFHQFRPIPFVGYMALLVGPFMPPIFLHLPLPNAVDGSFWTLRYEFWCYVIVALLGAVGLLARRTSVLVLCGMIVAFVILRDHALIHVPVLEIKILGNTGRWPGLLLPFALGMAYRLYDDRIRLTRAFALVALVVLAASLALHILAALTVPICGSYLLLCAAYAPNLHLQEWGRYGDFSYGIYVLGFPVQQLLILYAGRHLTPITLFFAAMLVTTLLAALSWHFVEKPCLKMKPSSPPLVGA
jgi:peptidoglycan/LPS O-acetylase OafA/YrhL